MTLRLLCWCWMLASGLLSSSALGSAAPPPLTVYAAASLTEALQACADRYTAETGKPIRLSFAASSALARQIEAGAQADLFVSADTEWMDFLSQRGLIQTHTRRDLVGNRLVLIAARDEQHRIYQTIEHGTYGGTLLDGVLFGYARNASAMLDAATQFDFYAGGGLDIAFLGFGEFDAHGNVNVSRLGGLTVGPGGFIDIAQNARKVVFCGTLAAKGVRLQTGDGQMRVLQQGAVKKLVPQVEQITFSGAQSLLRGQQVLYLTERASFRLTPHGVELFEVAPGIDVQRDVLDQMGFVPRLASPLGVMSAEHFLSGSYALA